MKGYQSPALLRVWVFCSQRQLVPKEVKENSSLWLGTCNRAELVLTLCSRSSEQPHYRQEKQIRGNISTETAGQFQGHKPIWAGSGLAPPRHCDYAQTWPGVSLNPIRTINSHCLYPANSICSSFGCFGTLWPQANDSLKLVSPQRNPAPQTPLRAERWGV